MKRYSLAILAALVLVAVLAIGDFADGHGMPSLQSIVSPPVTPIDGGHVRLSVHRADPRVPGALQAGPVFVRFTILGADGSILGQTLPMLLLPTTSSFFDIIYQLPIGQGGPQPVVGIIALTGPNVQVPVTASIEVMDAMGMTVSSTSAFGTHELTATLPQP